MRILVSTTTGLGNAVLLTPFLYTLHKNLPDAEIDVIGGSPWGSDDIIGNLEFINKLYKIDSSNISKAIKEIIKLPRYDFCFFPYLASNLKVLIIIKILRKAKKIIGHISLNTSFKYIALSRFIMDRAVVVHPLKHECWDNLLLTRSVGIDEEKWITEPVLPKGKEIEIRVMQDYCVLHLTTTNNQKSPKQWYSEYWVEVGKFILANTDLNIVLAGEKAENHYGSKFHESLGNSERIYNLVGKTDILELIYLLQNSILVIGCDSGITHISGALNKKTIVLWGPSIFTKSHQLGQNTYFVIKGVMCSPCTGLTLSNDMEAFERCPEKACMRAIKPKDVINLVRILNN